MSRLPRLKALITLAILASSASGLAADPHSSHAPPAVPAPSSPLAEAFDAAWLRQPEARSAPSRLMAAEAGRDAATRWTAEPPSVELSVRSDRFNRNAGEREYEAGLAIPLWLPGERSGAQRLADAQLRAVSSRVAAARLRTAGAVRSAYWTWRRAAVDRDLAEARLTSARRLTTDVGKRVRAGDLARTDRNRADGALAGAEADLARARATLTAARLALQALTGNPPHELTPGTDAEIPAEPSPPAGTRLDGTHPALVELETASAQARSTAALAQTRSRANPELTLAVTRERGQAGDPFAQSLTLGVRIPFGGGARHRAEAGMALADAMETEDQAHLERLRLESEVVAAHEALAAAREQLAAASTRARLADETQGQIEKSFRLGETGLPVRLNVELEATEARRALAHARIDHAAAVSSLRQALGLLPQ